MPPQKELLPIQHFEPKEKSCHATGQRKMKHHTENSMNSTNVGMCMFMLKPKIPKLLVFTTQAKVANPISFNHGTHISSKPPTS